MRYEYFNPNPENRAVGDCVIRAICKAFDYDWERAYCEVCLQGFILHDIPSSDSVWGTYLKRNGFKKFMLPDICPDCYTVSDFSENCPVGTYVVKTAGHVLTIVDGIIYDSWDSSNEVVIYYYQKVGE